MLCVESDKIKLFFSHTIENGLTEEYGVSEKEKTLKSN